jgi:probable F420-dependent oxidoreductase
MIGDGHKFRFAMQMTSAPTGEHWTALARRFEDEGYDVISLPDHLGPQFAPVPALAAIAAVTSRVRLSMFVMANDFRNPAVLAKEITTLDVLSGGRVELGLGAGWNAAEYAAQGVQFDVASVRIERLAEAVTILKRTFAGERFSFEGAHYRVTDLEVWPRALQTGGIPLVLGGGAKRMLSLAGREADVVGIATNNSLRAAEVGGSTGLSDDVVREQISWVREAAGARFDQIRLNLRVLGVAVAATREAGAAALAAELGAPEEMLLRSPFVFVGPTSAIHDQLLRYREELGLSYYTVSQRHADQLVPLLPLVSAA